MSASIVKHPLWIALPLYALDQATKYWIVTHIEYQFGSRTVIPDIFELVNWGNTGAAFSAFHDQNLFFSVLSLATLVALLFYWSRGAFRRPLYFWGVSLLMSGILGNVTDRLNPARRHVVDFLLFDLHVPFAHPWPAFNVADSCICVAVALFMVAAWRESVDERRGAAQTH